MPHPLTKLISLFHDGYITSCKQENNAVTFKIEVEYLAQTYNNNFSCFFLRLYDMQDILLIVYRGDKKEEFTDLDDIIKLEPGIGRCKEVDGRVVISGDIFHAVDKRDCYSELSFRCSSFAIYDEAMVEVKPAELEEVAARYWEKGGSG